MSFDTQTRNRLASFVGKCRTLLCGDFKSPGGEMARQLAHYGIQDTGKFFEVDSLTHLDEPGRETARTLRSILAHKQASAPAAKVWKKFDAAVYDLIQEQGFTVLNRLCALRMAEERKILQFPCISKGLQSDGFELYEYHTGKANAAISKEDRFQHFVFSLFDELSLDLGSLFDRFSPQGLLFPAPQALGELLALINDPALAHLWAEDETIGWIYQYWNSKEERKAMRDASAAPRNSRELAVRNQFFTPRYVVQFLTDNTLGRIWYEMCQGKTGLVEQCEYLVRRPNEVFLGEGESAPEFASVQCSVSSEEGSENCQLKTENLTQEVLLKQPVYIPFRPLKDPREIRLLDPACGSMHFGLYAFDLFEKIYSEFWDLTIAEGGAASSTDHRSLITDHSLQPLPHLYASKQEYMRDVPKMIIENNVHGIDIDPRAAQIAGLALWLRAQRSWQSAGLLATQRPKVERSNIVCAEPMPGDKEQLAEFTARLHPAIALMVAAIFEKMQLAGEAGSLLKIEEEITTLVDDAKAAWKRIGKHAGEMFSTAELANADRRAGTQTQLDIGSWTVETLSAISDSDFFEQAEQTIYQALARYSESASQGSYKRKLFAQDAAQGFAFIDLCRNRYDAVVMNPPFGEAAVVLARYADETIPEWGGNLACAFVLRMDDLLTLTGLNGAICDNSTAIRSSYESYRIKAFLDQYRLATWNTLGWDVLDANVETFMMTRGGAPGQNGFFGYDYRKIQNKQGKLEEEATNNFANATWILHEEVRQLPNCVIDTSWPEFLRRSFVQYPNLSEVGLGVLVGHQLEADRHYRFFWEIDPFLEVKSSADWAFGFKGGEYSVGYLPADYVAFVGADFSKVPEKSANVLRNKTKHFHRGVCYGKRGEFVDAQPLREGLFFTHEGFAFVSESRSERATMLALLNSKFFNFGINKYCGQHKTNGYVNLFPAPPLDVAALSKVEFSLTVILQEKYRWWSSVETDYLFSKPLALRFKQDSIEKIAATVAHESLQSAETIAEKWSIINDCIFSAFALTNSNIAEIEDYCAAAPKDSLRPLLEPDGNLSEIIISELVSYISGISFGQFTKNEPRETILRDFDDFFSSLPQPRPCIESIGTHKGTRGILVSDPARPEDIVARVRDALAVIWGERSGVIEQEACDILKVKELRDYFSEGKSGGKFFKDHLKRYSKSRRKAPIYWPISTESGDYTLWFYYHRLSEDSLYTAVTQFIVPRQEEAAATFARLGAKQDRSKAEDKELESAQTLVAELATLKDSLLEIAKFWKPNLNDGVQITAAPLWKHFRLGAWQKDLKDTWSQLQKGEYDWAHLAHSTWPRRVIPKCTTDRSLAIAHGHEQALWEEVENAKGKLVWQPKKDATEIARELVRQHGK